MKCTNHKYFFLNKYIYFNWRLITLQYCSGFAIHWYESATGVHVFPILNPLPPPSPSHSSGSSQCTSPEHPVSCIKPGLAICFTYDNIHVSVPFSHIIPPSPSPPESKILFYTSVSLLLSCMQGYHYHHKYSAQWIITRWTCLCYNQVKKQNTNSILEIPPPPPSLYPTLSKRNQLSDF